MKSSLTMAATALFTVACTTRPSTVPFEPASHESAVGRTVYDLDLKALGRRDPVRLSEFRGKAVLLNVWASWCPPCRRELPMLDDAFERLRAKGVEIVAVTIDESAQDAEDFLQARPNWSLHLAHDPSGRSLHRLEVQKMPTSYVIDRNGVIRAVYTDSDRQDFQTIEKQLLDLAAAP
jgi:thiol-disulfide isomerase/thioredoxin